MQIIKKARYLFKDFFFQQISESEVIIFFYFLFLGVIEHRGEIAVKIFAIVKDFWLITNPSDFFEALIVCLFLVLILSYTFGNLIWFACSKTHWKDKEKLFFSFWFYSLLSAFSIYSLISFSSLPDNSRLSFIYKLSLIFMTVRSLFTLLITLILSKLEKLDLLLTQITNRQINFSELFLTLIIGGVLYLLIRPENNFSSTVVLCFFYTSTLLLFYRTITNSFSLKNN